MEGDDFSTKEIVSSGEISRDLDINFTTAAVHVFDAPVVIVSDTFA
jgi:hypothetical protein